MSRFRMTSLFSALSVAGAFAFAQPTPMPTPTAAPTPAAARRPLSPPGTAATQVAGRWAKVEGSDEPRYTDGKWIEVTYSRPIKRGRQDLFGKGAAYGKKITGDDAPLWRLGANQTTRLKTEVGLEIGGKKLAPGEYSLFVDLKESGWTLVISSQEHQQKYDESNKTATWGASGYDPKFDVVRVPMKMMKPAVSVDQFTIGFADMTDSGGKLAMAWDREGAVVEFKVVS